MYIVGIIHKKIHKGFTKQDNKKLSSLKNMSKTLGI